MRRATLPFLLTRGSDSVTVETISTTRETVHGLLRLEGDQLTIQWRVGRRTDHFGSGMRTDEEVEPVREISVHVSQVAGAAVHRRWFGRLLPPRLVLTASDLTAFEGLAGAEGLQLEHPAELVLSLRRADRLAAEEFSAELALAVAARGLPGGSEADRLGDGGG